MRDISDPNNPYAGQYQDWDIWLAAHPGSPSLEERQKGFSLELPRNWVWRHVSVSHEGYIIPALVGIQQEWAGVSAEEISADSAAEECKPSFEVWGEMPFEMYARLELAELRLQAPYLLAIPRWLADAPPISARVWPDGKVTTHGALGSWSGRSDTVLLTLSSWTTTPEPYFLYSEEGKLIRQTLERQNETDLFDGDYRKGDVLDELFYADWEDKMFGRGMARGWRGCFIENDYYTWHLRDTDSIIEAYDLDGTRHGPEFDINARSPHHFVALDGDLIPKVYKAQQACK